MLEKGEALVQPQGTVALDAAPQGNQSRVVQRTEGMDVSRDALLPPIIKLIQATSKDAARYGAGKFLRVDTEEVFDDLEVIPLVSRVTQTKWPGEFSREATPTCWSDNGIMASQGAEFEGRECHACPFFAPRPTRGKGRELCETGHNLILQDANSYTPYGLRVRSTGNRIMGLISSPSIAQKAVVKLYSELETNSTGQWYQLKVKTLRLLDAADRDLAVATMRSYLETNLGQAAADTEQEAAGEDQADPGRPRHPVVNGFEVTVRGEPEMWYTPTGKAITTAMGQTPQGYRKLVAWEALAEQFNAEVRKGEVLVVTGQYRVYETVGKDGGERKEEQLVLDNFQRLGYQDSSQPLPRFREGLSSGKSTYPGRGEAHPSEWEKDLPF